MSSMPVVLATGCLDHKIRLWDASSGYCSKTYTFGESQVNCIQISQDKKLIAAGGNPFIFVFEKFSQWLYSGSEDGTIKIWDPRFNNSLRSYDCGFSVNTVALSPNQSTLISGDQSGCVKVWDLETDNLVEEVTPIQDTPVRSISISSDGTLVVVGSHKGKVFVYSLKEIRSGLQLINEFQAHDSYLLKCIISPDMSILATTSADKSIKLWNTNDWSIDRTLLQHQKWVWDAAFSADSVYLVSASSDLSGKLWDLRTGEVIRNYVGHTLAATCIALNDSS
eukprot:gene19239-25090_t